MSKFKYLREGVNLYQHQKVALMYLGVCDSFLLRMEQGTGKTLPTLYHIYGLLKRGTIKNALVVCPKTVIASWERDIELFEDKTPFKALTVVNYDKVWRGDYSGTYDLIVLDEAHCIANRSSKRSMFLLELSTRAKYRYLLTGTPLGNGRVEDLYSLITFLDPYKVRSRIYSNIWRQYTGGKGSYAEWCKKFAFLDQYHKPFRYKNLNVIQEVINKYSYSVLKVDCLDLPDKLPDEIREIEQAEASTYKQMLKTSVIKELELLADIPLTKLLYLRQICSGHIKDTEGVTHSLKCNKLEALGELLEELGGKKLVIFCEFTRSLDNIADYLTKAGVSYIRQDGASKKDNWRTFQNSNTYQVILCQYQSACQGIDLYTADTTLFYEPTLKSNTLEQARDRTHRNGQKQKCSYIHFITKGTVEREIYRALAGYKDFSERLFTTYVEEYQRAFRKGG